MKKISLFIGLWLFCQTFLFSQVDTVRIVYYNLLNFNGSNRIEYLRTVLNYAKPDVLVVTEMASTAGCDAVLGILGSNYSRAAFTDGDDTDNMIYFRNRFILRSQDTIQTELRLINEYVLYYDTVYPNQDTTFLRFYAAHLKSSSGTTNEQQRLREVKRFTHHINNLNGANNIFFGGDMNFYTHNEPAYQELISNAISINDPLGNSWTGDWNSNPSYASIHTQSTRVRQFGGGAYGGMDDRFDFIFVTNDVISGAHNIRFTGHYKAIGNDGQHYNDSINALPNNDVPDSVANALHYMSDHLPVMMKVSLNFPNNINEKGSSNDGFDIMIKPERNGIYLKFKNAAYFNKKMNFELYDIKGLNLFTEEIVVSEGMIDINFGFQLEQMQPLLLRMSRSGFNEYKKVIVL